MHFLLRKVVPYGHYGRTMAPQAKRNGCVHCRKMWRFELHGAREAPSPRLNAITRARYPVVWVAGGKRCHDGDGATELVLVLAVVVGPLCGSSPGTLWSSRESGQRPHLWGVSGSQASYCVARLTTAAARRARSDALAPLYSPRISCPPRPPVFGLSRADRRRACLPGRGFAPHPGSFRPPWIRRAVQW